MHTKIDAAAHRNTQRVSIVNAHAQSRESEGVFSSGCLSLADVRRWVVIKSCTAYTLYNRLDIKAFNFGLQTSHEITPVTWLGAVTEMVTGPPGVVPVVQVHLTMPFASVTELAVSGRHVTAPDGTMTGPEKV